MNRNSSTAPLLLALAMTLITPLARGQEAETVSVPLSDPSKPARVHASLVKGSIHVEAYDGTEVLVSVASMEPVGKEKEKEKEKREPKRTDGLRRIPNASSGMTVEEDHNDVEISVRSWSRAANLEIKVPHKTSLKISTVNGGDIEVHGVEGELELGNTNGSIKALDVAGSVVATTINGDLTVTLRAVTPDTPMAFSNLNGDIDVTFPANIKADLRMRSDMGEILTDFDVDTVATTKKSSEGGEGKGFRLKIEKEIQAKLGGGGPEITFKNFNGDILIRKGG